MQKQSESLIKTGYPVLHSLIIIIIFLAPVGVYLLFPSLFSGADARVTDALFRLRYALKGKEKISPYVIHVVFDDATIAEHNITLADREIYGDVIDVLSHAGVTHIGYDIFFESELNHTTDALLVNTVKKQNTIYFPLIVFKENISKTHEFPSSTDHELIDKNLIFPHQINRGNPPEAAFVLIPFPGLVRNAAGLGHINCAPDPDGVNRRFPLVFRYKNGYIPSLTFRMICDFLRVDSDTIDLCFGKNITLRNAHLPGNIKKNIKIPIDLSGRVLINFTAPWRDSFYDYSVKEILKTRDSKSLAVQLYDEMEDSMVIISDVSTRNKDFGPGVFDSLYPYSEIHMTVANMILTGNFLYRTDKVVLFFISLVCAGLMGFFVTRFKAGWFVFATLTLFILFAAFSVFGFVYGSIVTVMVPGTTGFAVALIAGVLIRYFQAEKQRIWFQLKVLSEKKLNLELKAIDELKNKLISTITHELKNPLMVITAPLKLLAAHYNEYSSDEVMEKIKQVKHGAQRLHTLVEELLFVAKLKSHKEVLRAEEIDINAFVRETAGPYISVAEKRGISLHIAPLPVEVQLYIDQVKIHKVISNLLSNAIKFTKTGGRIDVEISRHLLFEKHPYSWKGERPKPKHIVKITVKDTGIGIPGEYCEDIFKLFFTVKDEQKPTFTGTGIGLYLVKEYIDLHHGVVRIESTYGKGSVFTLLLPAGKVHLEKSELSKTIKTVPVFNILQTEPEKKYPFKDKPSSKAIKEKILVVDDDDDVRILLRHILSENYSVLEARNGKEGFDEAKSKNPDLILSDILMPEMDGIQFCTKIKNDPALKDIPFILITARTSIERDGDTADVDDFLAKPCDPGELLKRVKNIITLKKQKKIINSYKNSHMHPLKLQSESNNDEIHLPKSKADKQGLIGNKPLFPVRPIIIADVDDDMKPAYRYTLSENGYTNIEFAKTCKNVMRKIKEKKPCLLLLNQKRDNLSTNLILDTIKEESSATQVIIITGQSDVDKAIACIKQGAYDYLITPVDINRFITSVNKAIENYDLKNAVSIFSHSSEVNKPDLLEDFPSIITRNEKMIDTLRKIKAFAPGNKPFLITGETGVGKELIAKAIHKASSRPEPFIPVNSGSLDDTLFSDTLFGHKKGAYTGADSNKDGLIKEAGTGTLFLDEIGDLTGSSQTKLLRLLQENEFLPLGANKPEKNHARIIAATNKDLQLSIKKNNFRKDVYERFTFKLHIPPLRERPDDIPILARHFFQKYTDKYKKKLNPLSPELFRLLQRYHFPGNVRELENMLENAVLLCTGTDISLSSIKEHIEIHSDMGFQKDITDNRFNYSGDFPTLDEMKSCLIREAMKITQGKIGVASRLLGISRFSLGRWLKGEDV